MDTSVLVDKQTSVLVDGDTYMSCTPPPSGASPAFRGRSHPNLNRTPNATLSPTVTVAFTALEFTVCVTRCSLLVHSTSCAGP